MGNINDEVFDQGLDYATSNVARLDICSADPVLTYANVTANTLGNSTTVTAGAAEAGDTDGRKVVIAAITTGAVSGTGTASHWAATDGTSTVIASGSLTTQSVSSGNTFTLDAINVTIRDST